METFGIKYKTLIENWVFIMTPIGVYSSSQAISKVGRQSNDEYAWKSLVNLPYIYLVTPTRNRLYQEVVGLLPWTKMCPEEEKICWQQYSTQFMIWYFRGTNILACVQKFQF
jgi:hypothetical protein